MPCKVELLSCNVEVYGHYATVIPSRITPFSFDHGRQTGLGQISTTSGDHAGISGAVAFWYACYSFRAGSGRHLYNHAGRHLIAELRWRRRAQVTIRGPHGNLAQPQQ